MWRREARKILRCEPRRLILNSKSWNLDSRLEGCGIRAIDGLFFKFLKDKDQKIEDWFDPQPDSAIQHKARGLLHIEREFITHHIKEDDSGLEHLIASMQPRKYSKNYSKHSMEHWWIPEALEVLEESFRSTWCLQYSTTKSSGACQTRAHRTVHIA
jgi:hypothetical protein